MKHYRSNMLLYLKAFSVNSSAFVFISGCSASAKIPREWGVKLGIVGTNPGEKTEFVLNPVMYDLEKRYFHRNSEDLFLLMTRG